MGRFSIHTVEYPPVRFLEPIADPALVREVANAARVLTDSVGLHKEAFLLRTPCMALQAQTERPKTAELGRNRLAQPKSEGNAVFFAGFKKEITLLSPTAQGQKSA